MNTTKIIGLLVILAFNTFCTNSYSQLAIDNSGNNNNPEHLVQNVLVSTGVAVSNITFNGITGTLDTLNGKMIGYSASLQAALPTTAYSQFPNS